MRLLALMFVCLATTTHANQSHGCQDLWFTRNLIMDRAGYCFGSTLGQTLFDNADCIGDSVSVPPGTIDLVARIRSMEAEYGCDIDTNRTSLGLDDILIRRFLLDLPLRSAVESACLNWTGPVTGLRAGHSGTAPVIGRIDPGDVVSFAYDSVGDWVYVTVYDATRRLKSGGWLRSQGQFPCDDWAG